MTNPSYATAEPTCTYKVVHDRIGRNHNIRAMTFDNVADADELAALIYERGKRHLLSEHAEVTVDLAAKRGEWYAGLRLVGRFTIEVLDGPSPVSWDATLIVTANGHKIEVGAWNHSHNCSEMIDAALDAADPSHRDGRSWLACLDGQTGTNGDHLLSPIITELETNPSPYLAMNQPNAWGIYRSLLKVLREMRNRAKAFPSGRWTVT